ncbi:unnamed protein product [Callosobruchus maculatus]|uniref:DUF4371 domain-containing protein n=1 Tax=Callosobruchus maculatus TaxID=64391 RepID=A0A653CNV8_CALMS|nr:unnamed protein product [Callosobruchus maculatus]
MNKIGVPVKNLRFQSYDGASNMSEKFNGLAAKFKEVEPRALYFHCHAHLLVLAVARTCEETKSLRNALGSVNNLYNIIQASAKRHDVFQKGISEVCPDSDIKTLRSLSQTRWIMRYVSVKAVLSLLPAIIQTLVIISNDGNNTKISAGASGLLTNILDEEFLLSLIIIELILGTTTILSKHLQSAEITISLVLPKINATIATLQGYRTAEYFCKIFEKMKTLAKKNKRFRV